MKQQAHYHPSLPDRCEVCEPEESWTFLQLVSLSIGVLCFLVVVWFVVTSL